MNKNELKNILGGYFGREIAGDFRVLKEHEIAHYNDAAKFPFEGDSGLLREFCIFADSGTGDLWLLSSDGEIAFYDHDLEFLSEANLKKFDLNLAGWFEIAELFAKFEALDEPNASQKAEFEQSVAKICPQILEIWEI
ncbi:hypothetical protein [Campylobacter sp.]|uniref:hypothetical protein n=1 Tax=Campylobacter sp. TaxID=205 RepID=UPI0025EFAD79|nr:hypothetical protein [Campylobacter sp.]